MPREFETWRLRARLVRDVVSLLASGRRSLSLRADVARASSARVCACARSGVAPDATAQTTTTTCVRYTREVPFRISTLALGYSESGDRAVWSLRHSPLIYITAETFAHIRKELGRRERRPWQPIEVSTKQSPRFLKDSRRTRRSLSQRDDVTSHRADGRRVVVNRFALRRGSRRHAASIFVTKH